MADRKQPAVIHRARRVVTLDPAVPAVPAAETVAVRGDRILGVGSVEEMRSRRASRPTGPTPDVVLIAGGVASLPHAVPHVFQVLSPSARMLTVVAGRTATPSFDRFVATLGEPTDPDDLPAPVEIDPGRVGAVGAAHGIEILGPPPAPPA